jgi:hypothetical protein
VAASVGDVVAALVWVLALVAVELVAVAVVSVWARAWVLVREQEQVSASEQGWALALVEEGRLFATLALVDAKDVLLFLPLVLVSA